MAPIERQRRPLTDDRLRRAEAYAMDRLACAHDKDRLWGPLVDGIQTMRERILFGEDEGVDHNPNAWLCNCGNYIEDGLHCEDCGASPPWGCPCSGCQDGWVEEDGENDEQVYGEDYP